MLSVCVFFPFILDKFVGCTSRGHTGGSSHRIFYQPSFCGACLHFSREKNSAVPFPRRPRSRILCTDDLIVLHSLGILILIYFFSEEKSQLSGFELTSQGVRRLRGYQLSYRGDLHWVSSRHYAVNPIHMLLPSRNPIKCHEDLCLRDLCSHLNGVTFPPLSGGCSAGLDTIRFFFKILFVKTALHR